jgi:hypothetical protein
MHRNFDMVGLLVSHCAADVNAIAVETPAQLTPPSLAALLISTTPRRSTPSYRDLNRILLFLLSQPTLSLSIPSHPSLLAAALQSAARAGDEEFFGAIFAAAERSKTFSPPHVKSLVVRQDALGRTALHEVRRGGQGKWGRVRLSMRGWGGGGVAVTILGR